MNTGLIPHIKDDNQSILFKNASGKTCLKYHKLRVFDDENNIIPAYFETEGEVFTIAVDDRDAKYPIVVDPIIESQKKLPDSYLSPGDQFGASVAIGSDVLVVGAPGQDGFLEDSGAVYIFKLECISYDLVFLH